MAHALRWGSCVALLGLAFISAYVFLPNWRAAQDQGIADAPRLLRTQFEELGREADLGRRLEAARARLRAQNRICRELIDGQINLATAIRRFGALPGIPDHFQDLLQLQFDGATDEERLGQLVIYWACNLVENDPDRAEALRAGWQTELARATAGRSPPPGGPLVIVGDVSGDRVPME
jgi:hypothetical protein